jgi:hypothetical protein
MNDYDYSNRFSKSITTGTNTLNSQSMMKESAFQKESTNLSSISYLINNENKVNDYKYLYNTKFRNELINSINSCRTNSEHIATRINYPPLKKNNPMKELGMKSELSQAADDLVVLLKLYNNDLSEEHRSKTRSRINKYGASYGYVHEIVIIGFSDMETFLFNLISSDNRDIILNPNLNYMGLAIDMTLDNKLLIVLDFAEHLFAHGDIIPNNILKKYSIEKKYLVPTEETYKPAVVLNQSVNPLVRKTKSIKPDFSIRSDRITHYSTDYGNIEERHTTKVRKTQPVNITYNDTRFSNKTYVPNVVRPKWDHQSYNFTDNNYKDDIRDIKITETPDKKTGSLIRKVINYKDGSSETFIFKKD